MYHNLPDQGMHDVIYLRFSCILLQCLYYNMSQLLSRELIPVIISESLVQSVQYIWTLPEGN